MAHASKPVIVIGGITGGIGSCLARMAVEKGYTVAGFARGLRERGGLPEDLRVETVDATDPEAVVAFMNSIASDLGRIDGYVHAIGSVMLKTAHTLTLEEWRETLAVNLDSAFFAARALLPILQKQNGGNLIFLSSVAARAGLPAHEAIAAAKGGVDGLVLSIAASYASRQIRCNAVAPGLVETPMTAGVIASPQARSISEKMHPLGRIGRPDNIAGLILWLLSEEADWVTGQIWSVDGGMAHVRQRPKA